jgi:hypothetical protein
MAATLIGPEDLVDLAEDRATRDECLSQVLVGASWIWLASSARSLVEGSINVGGRDARGTPCHVAF